MGRGPAESGEKSDSSDHDCPKGFSVIGHNVRLALTDDKRRAVRMEQRLHEK